MTTSSPAAFVLWMQDVEVIAVELDGTATNAAAEENDRAETMRRNIMVLYKRWWILALIDAIIMEVFRRLARQR